MNISGKVDRKATKLNILRRKKANVAGAHIYIISILILLKFCLSVMERVRYEVKGKTLRQNRVSGSYCVYKKQNDTIFELNNLLD